MQITVVTTGRPDSTYPIIISPYKLDLSQFTEKTREKINFKIANVSDKKIKLTLVDQQTDYFVIKLPSSINPGSSAEGTLTLKPKAVEETFEKSFTMQLDDEKKSRFTVPVRRVTSKTVIPETTPAATAAGH